MTNADKIRAMTDEELAHYFSEQPGACPGRPGCSGKNCYDCWLDWLKQETPAPPQKKPLCDTCKHAIDGVVDDFAAVFCGARQGYFGQVTECEKYERKQTE